MGIGGHIRGVAASLFILTILACGGGGGSSTNFGTFTQLDAPPGNGSGAGTAYAVSNSGVVAGKGQISVVGFAGFAPLFWTGATCTAKVPNQTGLNYAYFIDISPNGNWIAGFLNYQLPGGGNYYLPIRYDRVNNIMSICPDMLPAVWQAIYTTEISNTGDVSGFGAYSTSTGSGTTLPAVFTWPSVGSFSMAQGTPFDSTTLTPPAGTTSASGGRFSSNHSHVAGTVQVGATSQGVVWNAFTGVGTLTGYLATNVNAQTSATWVSDDGQLAMVSGLDNNGDQAFGLWQSGVGLKNMIDYLHEHGKAVTWDKMSECAMSPDGHHFAGLLGPNGSNQYLAFTFTAP